MDIPPNQTIYVNNLYEKLSKEELKKCLYSMFSPFGKILDVVALKTYRLRGQAWIVFADVASATNAMRSLQGFPFFDKPIRITFARSKSDAVAKLEGTYKPDKDRAKRNAVARDHLIKRGQEKKVAGAAAPAGAVPGGAPHGDAHAPPNKILFVQGLPEATTSQMLALLFQQFPGYVEVRMVEAKPGIAFVEFENDMQSSVAMSGLNGFKVTPTHAMNVSYAKQ